MFCIRITKETINSSELNFTNGIQFENESFYLYKSTNAFIVSLFQY